MPHPDTDSIIQVPLQALRQSYGFSLDLGTSTTKVAYRSRKGYTNGEPIDTSELESGKGCIHLTLFCNDPMEDVIAYIKSNCDLLENKSQNAVHVCGYCLNDDVKTLFEKELDCQIVRESDKDMSGKGLVYLLRTFNCDDIFYPPSAEGLEKGTVLCNSVSKFWTDNEHSRGRYFTWSSYIFVERKDEEHKLPAVVGEMADSFRFNKIDKSGQNVEHLFSAPMGGGFFHGICGFFSGTKDYPTLVKMAEEHTGETVETTLREFQDSMPKDKEETMYNQEFDLPETMLDEFRIFIMDKMISGNRESTKPGDGVRSLLVTVCENASYHIYDAAVKAKLKKIYLSGSFIQPAIVREWLTVFLLVRNGMNSNGEPLEFEFLRYGSHTGALGAFLQSF